MAKASGEKSQPEFLSTHPLPTSRIANLTKNMPRAIEKYGLVVHKPNCKI